MKKYIFAYFILISFSCAFGQTTHKKDLPHSIACENINAPASVRAMYVSNADHIIYADPPYYYRQVTSKSLVNWAVNHDFNHLVLYGIIRGVSNYPNSFPPKFWDFMEYAHSRNVTVSVITGSDEDADLLVDDLLTPAPTSAERFDGIQFEFEFWKSSNFSTPQIGFQVYLPLLQHISTLCDNNSILCETYIGNPSNGTAQKDIYGQNQIDQITLLSDRTYVAYFLESPYDHSTNNIFGSKQYRWNFLENAAGNSNIITLFKAQNSGDDMYEWLDDLTKPFSSRWKMPYNVWMRCNQGYNDLPSSNVNVLGYCWFTFQDLHKLSRPSLDNVHRIKVTPNPTDGEIKISRPDSWKEVSYRLISKSTNQEKMIGRLQEEDSTIDLGGLEQGTYILELRTNNGELHSSQVVRK